MQSARTIPYYMNNQNGAGFTVDEWQQMTDQQLSFLERAVVYLAPFASLTANAMAHLRKDWVEWYDEFVHIEIPLQASCNSFKTVEVRIPDQPFSHRVTDPAHIVETRDLLTGSNTCGLVMLTGATRRFSIVSWQRQPSMCSKRYSTLT